MIGGLAESAVLCCLRATAIAFLGAPVMHIERASPRRALVLGPQLSTSWRMDLQPHSKIGFEYTVGADCLVSARTANNYDPNTRFLAFPFAQIGSVSYTHLRAHETP